MRELDFYVFEPTLQRVHPFGDGPQGKHSNAVQGGNPKATIDFILEMLEQCVFNFFIRIRQIKLLGRPSVLREDLAQVMGCS